MPPAQQMSGLSGFSAGSGRSAILALPAIKQLKREWESAAAEIPPAKQIYEIFLPQK